MGTWRKSGKHKMGWLKKYPEIEPYRKRGKFVNIKKPVITNPHSAADSSSRRLFTITLFLSKQYFPGRSMDVVDRKI